MAACTEYLIYSTLTAQGYKDTVLHIPRVRVRKAQFCFVLMYRCTLFVYTYIFDSSNMLKGLNTLSFGFS